MADVDPIAAVHAAFQRARKRQQEMVRAEGTAPAWLGEFFTEQDKRDLHRAARAIREADPHAFALYAGETTVMGAIQDELERSDSVPSAPELAAELRQRAQDEGPWIVSTPIANLMPPREFMQLSDDVALVATDPDPNWAEDLLDNPLHERDTAIQRQFGKRVYGAPRWLDARYHVGPLDTRVAARLISREEGARQVALDSARGRTRYCIAVWSVLRPPSFDAVSPSLGVWTPQPYVDIGQDSESLGERRPRQSRTISYAEYTLADEPQVLQTAISAIAAVCDSRFAQAFLSACWSAYQATRFPTEAQTTDRLGLLYSAVAALCEEPGQHSDENVGRRWARLCDRLGVTQALRDDGYALEEARAAERLVLDARQISTHAADAVLLNLGYPPDAVRSMRGQRERAGVELARGAIHADLRLTLAVLHRVLRALADIGHASAWGDHELEALLAAS